MVRYIWPHQMSLDKLLVQINTEQHVRHLHQYQVSVHQHFWCTSALLVYINTSDVHQHF